MTDNNVSKECVICTNLDNDEELTEEELLGVSGGQDPLVSAASEVAKALAIGLEAIGIRQGG